MSAQGTFRRFSLQAGLVYCASVISHSCVRILGSWVSKSAVRTVDKKMSPVGEACGGVDYGPLACPKRGPFWCTYPRLRNSLFSKELDCAKRAVQNSAMKFGYARCSTEEQNLSLQTDALRAVGCEKVYEDAGVSGGAELTDRPGLDQCLLEIGEGDTLVVWKLDRLGRSLSFLIGFMDRCGKDGIEFKSSGSAEIR